MLVAFGIVRFTTNVITLQSFVTMYLSVSNLYCEGGIYFIEM
jgi:hypothetical protein